MLKLKIFQKNKTSHDLPLPSQTPSPTYALPSDPKHTQANPSNINFGSSNNSNSNNASQLSKNHPNKKKA